jgi:hypothetical protein
MAKTTRYTSVLEDVNGSFERFVRESPKIARQLCGAAVKTSAFALLQRMKATAPVGPDAPHMRDALDMKASGMSARVGILKGDGHHSDMAHIALYNEYMPNEQAFMRPAAQAEQSNHVRRMKEAIGQIERQLGSGVGV